MESKKIVICEKCYRIPKITILIKNKVQIDCQNCNESKIVDISYFDKFINNANDNQLFNMPKCNCIFENHDFQSILYCFQCNKYLCVSCLSNHDKFCDNKHITIGQKIKHEYYCKKKGHEEYLLDRFYIKCNIYSCQECRCSHKGDNIFNFKNDINIEKIKDNIKKCEEIIKDEEKSLQKLIEEIQNKIVVLKKLFDDYKQRNINSIFVYKLLIHNYE